MQYNTDKDKIRIRMYGRNVQNLLAQAHNIADREERSAFVGEIVSMMNTLNPQDKKVEDYKSKLWTHAFEMMDYALDVTPPDGVTIAPPDVRNHTPHHLPYPPRAHRKRHYGFHIYRMIDKAIHMADADERRAYTTIIAEFMKMAQRTYNRESIEDEVIKSDLLELSEGQLSIDGNLKIKNIEGKALNLVIPSLKTNNRNTRNGGSNNSNNNSNNSNNNSNSGSNNRLKQGAMGSAKQAVAAPRTKQKTEQPPKAVAVIEPKVVVAPVANTPAPNSNAPAPETQLSDAEKAKRKKRRGGKKHKKNKGGGE